MKTIHLYGPLAEVVGMTGFDFDVETPREAFQGLASQFPGFLRTAQRIGKLWIIRENSDREPRFMTREELDFHGGSAWHFVPCVEGADPGTIIAVIGGAIAAAAEAVGTWAAALTAVEIAQVAITVGTLAYSIYALTAGNPTPRATNKKEESLSNWGFRDVPALTQDGAVIPVILGGPLWIKPIVIGSRIRTY
jgi:predicted phage tail protein